MKSKFLIAVTGLLATVTMLASSPARADDSLTAIMTKKSISIGIPTDFPPFGFVGPDFKPHGLDVDVAKLIAEKLGVKANLVPVSTPNRIPYLQTDKIDLIVSALGKTPERAEVIDFSIPYAPFYLGVFGPKDMTIKSYADLADKTVAVTRGTIQADILQKLAPPTLKIDRFQDDASTISAFVSGQTQLLATGVSAADTAIKKNPDLHAELKLVLKDSPNYVGVRKGDSALLAKVNGILRQERANGTLNAYSEHWLGRGLGNLPD
ncbi:cystine-binding periplasmic protein precursor [mine drainage metagenome]|uniref:Cystine-binding periplasmic protein n=1 Tax=mine drainage metagenome TaxID=410659 RepID=A0A1J5PXF8_9ZZZZ